MSNTDDFTRGWRDADALCLLGLCRETILSVLLGTGQGSGYRLGVEQRLAGASVPGMRLGAQVEGD